MERLTFEGNFCDIAQCRELPCPYNGACSQRKVWERLKAYEDTGLTPEEIKELLHDTTGPLHHKLGEWIDADASGRLVVLPCKVGDVVYGFYGIQTILPMVVKWIETNTDGWTVAAQYSPMAPNFYRFSDFGKTVFRTLEQAEKALEAMKNV